MSDGVEVIRILGQLEGKLVAKLDAHGTALKKVADEVQAVSARVATLETERDHLRKAVQRSAHDLSEYKSDAGATNDAIKRHISIVEKQIGTLITSTAGQDAVLVKQNKVLGRIDRLHPVLILVASMLGAAASGYFHSAPQAPETGVHR